MALVSRFLGIRLLKHIAFLRALFGTLSLLRHRGTLLVRGRLALLNHLLGLHLGARLNHLRGRLDLLNHLSALRDRGFLLVRRVPIIRLRGSPGNHACLGPLVAYEPCAWTQFYFS